MKQIVIPNKKLSDNFKPGKGFEKMFLPYNWRLKALFSIHKEREVDICVCGKKKFTDQEICCECYQRSLEQKSSIKK